MGNGERLFKNPTCTKTLKSVTGGGGYKTPVRPLKKVVGEKTVGRILGGRKPFCLKNKKNGQLKKSRRKEGVLTKTPFFQKMARSHKK